MYLVMAAVGLIMAGILVYHEKKKTELLQILSACFSAAVYLLIGAKLAGILSYAMYCIAENIAIGFNIFTESGIVFYGGLLGFLYGLKREKLSWENMQLISAVIPLFHAFARIGCYFSGCCFGKVSRFCALPYPVFHPTAMRIPIQLIEAGGLFILFFVLWYLYRKKKGNILSLYLISYVFLRFITEFFRGDAVRGILFGLSFSQYISIILFLVVICRTVKEKHRGT